MIACSREPPATVPAAVIDRVANALGNDKRTAIVLGAYAMQDPALSAAGRIAEASGATLLCETFPRRLERGAGRVMLQRIPYFAEQAIEFLKEFEQMILIGATQPVAFLPIRGWPACWRRKAAR